MEWLSTTYAICASDSDFTLTAVHYLNLSYSNLLGYSISSLYNSLDIFFYEGGGRRGGDLLVKVIFWSAGKFVTEKYVTETNFPVSRVHNPTRQDM